MPSCCVINCNNRTKIFRLFRLPTGEKNAKRRNIWLKNIGRKNWNPEVAFICEVHFTSDQFEQNRLDGRKLLKWNAIPTLFPSRKTKIKSRFVKNAKIPEDFPTQFGENKDGMLSCSKEVITLLLPQNSTAPVSSENVEKLSNEQPIVYVKFEPNQLQSEIIPVNSQSDMILKKDVLYLKRKIRTVNNKIKDLENIVTNFHKNLKLVFNLDQMQRLESDASNQNLLWSDETLNKAKDLYKTCGVDGYRQLLEQNLPFPPIELLKDICTES